jgi:hypothetical protein
VPFNVLQVAIDPVGTQPAIPSFTIIGSSSVGIHCLHVLGIFTLVASLG